MTQITVALKFVKTTPSTNFTLIQHVINFKNVVCISYPHPSFEVELVFPLEECNKIEMRVNQVTDFAKACGFKIVN